MLTLLDVEAERTTACTDALIAIVVIASTRSLRHAVPPSPARRLWTAAFGILGLTALLGGAFHAMRTSEANIEAFWRPLYAVAGFAFALILVGATSLWRGGRRMSPPIALMAFITLAFFALTWRIPNDELVLGIFASATMAVAIFALGAVGARGARTPERAAESLQPSDPRGGAWIALAGLLFFALAGAVQAARPLVVVGGWTLDHNGASHLVLLVAIALLARGVRDLLRE
jgi:hypothetical protein